MLFRSDSAFEDLRTRYDERVCSFLRRNMQSSGRRLSDEARDLAQDCWWRVVRTKTGARWTPSRGFVRPWLFTIVRNHLYEWLRVTRREPPMIHLDVGAESEESLEDADTDSQGPLDVVIHDEADLQHAETAAGLLEDCVAQLTDIERLLVTLWQGTRRQPLLGALETLAEVKAVLQIEKSISSLSRCAERGFNKIKDCLERKRHSDQQARDLFRELGFDS